MNFAIMGAAGFVAPRHLRAIRDTGHTVVAACDPHDAVGVLDSFGEARFFTHVEDFARYLDRAAGTERAVDYVSVCTPNHLHASHAHLALRAGASVICEKPLVTDLHQLDELEAVERNAGGRVLTVLQLRHHPALIELRRQVQSARGRHAVRVIYVTQRGPWYDASWKGDERRSGGLLMNIGIHLFDLMLWLFGRMQHSTVELRDARLAAGTLALESADVEWFLSTDRSRLPADYEHRGACRLLNVDGQSIEFSDGFGDLHTRVYEDVLAGRGSGISEARPALELVHALAFSGSGRIWWNDQRDVHSSVVLR